MDRLAVLGRSRAISHTGLLAIIAAALAGCSGEVTRFNNSDNPLGNPYAARSAQPTSATSAVPPAQPTSVARVDSQPLPPPPAPGATYAAPQYRQPAYSPPPYAPSPPPPPSAQPAYSPAPYSSRGDTTSSITRSSAEQRDWDWDGGTAVTVGYGDTIDTIAHRYGVPASAIVQANNISEPRAIRPGQRLVIPRYSYHDHRGHLRPHYASTAPARRGGLHVVAPGETLTSVSRLYGKPGKLIARANNLPPDVRLRIGQRLVIPGSRPASVAALAPTGGVKPALAKHSGGGGATPPVAVAPAPEPAPTSKKLAAETPIANARVAAPEAKVDEPPVSETGSATGKPKFGWPVHGRIIGPKTGQPNDGIDFAVPEGTSVKAAEDGVVAYAGNELKGYGNLILLRHSNGYVTAYAHASELMVKRGDQIKRGQIIARSGQTGNVSSPQLHFEIRKGAAPVDPIQYLSGA